MERWTACNVVPKRTRPRKQRMDHEKPAKRMAENGLPVAIDSVLLLNVRLQLLLDKIQKRIRAPCSGMGVPSDLWVYAVVACGVKS